MKHFLLFIHSLLLLVGVSINSFASCEIGESELIIDITPDVFFFEISWEVNHYLTDNTVLTGNHEGGVFCLPSDDCYDFTIFDSAGDGICCDGLQGAYSVYFEGELIASGGEYSGNEYAGSFGCANGKACSSALSVQDGFYSTPFSETFYEFTPNVSGLYSLSTCFSSNACNTAIWVYDYCQGLPYLNNLESAIKFSANGCGSNAELAVTQVNFVVGETYYIRIGHLEECNDPIFWRLEYNAPITDCTDPTACNFNPFAEISNNDLCQYEGGNDSCPGPDFWIDEEAIKNSLYLGTFNSNPIDCYMNEGCVNGVGLREVLRFDTKIHNIGEEDFYLGTPNEDNPLWVWDNCHFHFHFEDYAEYILIKNNNEILPTGYKTGFCLEDSGCPEVGDLKFGCNTQGLSVDCYDIYHADLNCQWIDITDVEAGIYSLVVRVNWNFVPDSLGRYEQDYTNNWAQVCFELFRDTEGTPSFEILENCDLYVDCAGSPYGDAVADCKGNCNGSALIGDLNSDGKYTTDDTQILANLVYNNGDYAKCYDMNGNGTFEIYDLALLHNCIVNDICDFPINNTNTLADVAINIERADIINGQLTEAATISVKNTNTRVSAYEISVENATIESYDLLFAPSYAQVYLNDSKTTISVIYPDIFLPFTNVFVDVLELQLAVTDIEEAICLNENTSAVSDQMLVLSPTIENACFDLNEFSLPEDSTTTSIQQLEKLFRINVLENAVLIENIGESKPFAYKLYNLQAQVVEQSKQLITSNIVEVNTQYLASGIYLLEIQSEGITSKRKLFIL